MENFHEKLLNFTLSNCHAQLDLPINETLYIKNNRVCREGMDINKERVISFTPLGRLVHTLPTPPSVTTYTKAYPLSLSPIPYTPIPLCLDCAQTVPVRLYFHLISADFIRL